MFIKKTNLTFILLLISILVNAQLPFSGTKSKKADKLFGEALLKYTAQDYFTASEILNKALKDDGKFIDAWMLLADISSKNEKYYESILMYKKIIDLSADFPLSYYGIAKDAIEISDYQQSYDNIVKFLVFPDYYKKKQVLKK